ncbi:hypothetical protein [Legionella massiliensis]|nr:hypothetical protein [Legionella massiliensis]
MNNRSIEISVAQTVDLSTSTPFLCDLVALQNSLSLVVILLFPSFP